MRNVPESLRERETFKFDPSLIANTVINESATPRPSSELLSSSDTALTALAQLASTRLNVTRALISLFDQKYQYIVAEATRSSPLTANTGHSRQGDGFWLCGTAIPRAFGICEHVLHMTSGAHERQGELPVSVIPNLHEDSQYSSRPYCHAPFFAGVPICSQRGIAIGVLSIFDNEVQAGLDGLSTQILRDLSRTISDYLASRRSRFNYNRLQRMVRGIGSFVEGKTTISDWHEGPTGPLFENNPGQEGALNAKQQGIEADTPIGGREDSLAQTAQYLPSRTPTLSQGAESEPATSEFVSSSADHHQATVDLTTSPATDISTAQDRNHLKQIFSKAANVIRESIEVEGVIFVDASVHSFGGLYRRSGLSGKSNSSETLTSDSHGEEDSNLHDRPLQERQDSRCHILGFSTSHLSSIDDESEQSYEVKVTEKFLAGLLRRYPRGKIFNFDENGAMQPSDSSGEEDASQSPRLAKHAASDPPLKGSGYPRERENEAAAIIKIFPGARSVAFVTLWDPQKQRWFAGGFVFTKDPTRVFTIEGDASYLQAFGMIAMGEVSRLDVLITDKAKSDILSSISHELRSPLHGLLLGAELLTDTRLDVFQGNMLHTIETCGYTLLDTIEHVLDYSKINKFMQVSNQQRRGSGARGLREDRQGTIEAGMSNLSRESHLDLIVEEVIDSVYLGSIFRQSPLAQPEHSSTESEGPRVRQNFSSIHARESVLDGFQWPEEAGFPSEDVNISLNLDPKHSWHFHTQPGAVRRIIMNLFGNSLKYTTRGSIKISLQQDAVRSKYREGYRIVRIFVEDTGKGISEDYLRNYLFQPFAQEDYLAAGVGLGLSLVKRITTSLGGTIKLSSRVGKGTKVSVAIPMLLVGSTTPKECGLGAEADFLARVTQLEGLRVCLYGFDDRNTVEGSKPASGVEFDRQEMETLCRGWLRMNLVPPGDTENVLPDLLLGTEASLDYLGERNLRKALPPMVIICGSLQRARQLSGSKSPLHEQGTFEFISQPVGPRKLAKVLLLCFRRWTEAQRHMAATSREAPPPAIIESDVSSMMVPFNTLMQHADKSLPNSQQPPFQSDSPRSSGTSELPSGQPVETRGSSTPLPRETEPTSLVPELSYEKPSRATGAVTNKMFLLVDDNKINLQILEAYAKKLGSSFSKAVNGKEAYELYMESSGQFNCILMDISMPVMDGCTSSRLIRTFERERQLPRAMIIALTGLASGEAQQEAFASGIDLFLTKPVRFKELDQIISQHNL